MDAGEHSTLDDIPGRSATTAVQLGHDDAITQLDRDAAAGVDPEDRSALDIHGNYAARGLVNDL